MNELKDDPRVWVNKVFDTLQIHGNLVDIDEARMAMIDYVRNRPSQDELSEEPDLEAIYGKSEQCPSCNGSGNAHNANMDTCSTCKGEGAIISSPPVESGWKELRKQIDKLVKKYVADANSTDEGIDNVELLPDPYPSPVSPPNGVAEERCDWKQDEDYDSGDLYETGCGESFSLANDEDLEANGFKYCIYCGKRIELSTPTEESK